MQRAQIEAVFEAIWPGTDDSPGARDVRAADYLDYLLGQKDELYEEIREWKALYVAGLAMLNAATLSRTGVTKALESLSVPEMSAVLGDLAQGRLVGFPDAAWQRQFFNTLRAHCIEGCLSDPRWRGNDTALMWRWLGYPTGKQVPFGRP